MGPSRVPLPAFGVVLLVGGAAFGAYLALRPSELPAHERAELPAPAPSAPVAPSASVVEPTRPPPPLAPDVDAKTLDEQRAALFERMRLELELDAGTLAEVQRIFAAAKYLGQGNPEISKHPMTRAACRDERAKANLTPRYDERCRAWNMVPAWNASAGETADDARVCVDQFEFPNVPCEYPVVWVQANEAAALCQAMHKRLCDAHEWEGACAGSVLPPETDYVFGIPRKEAKFRHNAARERRWAYGETKNHALCGTGSTKDEGCGGGGWRKCGSNTYPAGAFPGCVSPFGVYDQHGNAAEHMSLPQSLDELGARGKTGDTEMKGSWFIFASYEAHEDDCRFRAPDWHASRVADPRSHLNYHLGFRCCSDLTPPAP